MAIAPRGSERFDGLNPGTKHLPQHWWVWKQLGAMSSEEPGVPAFSAGLMLPGCFEGEGHGAWETASGFGCASPSPRHAWLWACPIGRYPRSRCSGRSKWLHPPFRGVHTPPCASQETRNAFYRLSKIFSFPSFVCFPNPHFFFGTSCSPGRASRERQPLLPLTTSSVRAEPGMPHRFFHPASLPLAFGASWVGGTGACHPGGALQHL